MNGDIPWGYINLKKKLKKEEQKAKEEGLRQAKKVAEKELRDKIKEEVYKELFTKLKKLSQHDALQPIEFIPKSEQGVVFLFGRFYEFLGFHSVTNVQNYFPDAEAIINGKTISIEFEFKLSAIRSHFKEIVEGKKLDFVICWEDDVYPENQDFLRNIASFLKKHNVKVIELKTELKSFLKI